MPTLSAFLIFILTNHIKQISGPFIDNRLTTGQHHVRNGTGQMSLATTYITTHNSARTLIRKIDRDELLNLLVKNYLKL